MLKRSISIVLLLCSLGLVGCSDSKTTTSNENQNKTVSESDYITDNVNISNYNDALKRLKEGNERFINNKEELINVTSQRREQLVDGQMPYAIVVACSDSRVTPELVFNAGLGEIFDIRLAGNVVDTDALGSIEYGVEHLGAPLIVVMGHEKCGAVTAAYDKLKNGTEVTGNLVSIVNKILPSIKDSDSLDEAIHDNTDNVAEQIENDPIIKELVESGKVKIIEAHYSLDGKVSFDE